MGGGPPPGQIPYTLAGVKTVVGSDDVLDGITITTEQPDMSAVLAQRKAKVRLEGVTIRTSGDASSTDNASFHGLNAGVLAESGAEVIVRSGNIVTTGLGANGAFAAGPQSKVVIEGTVITTEGVNAHGVMAAGGGIVDVRNATMTTTRPRSATLATDRGGGTLSVQGGSYTTHGTTSPVIYSTGQIAANDIKGVAMAAENVVVEGSNRVTLTGSDLSSGLQGALIYQSFSGDAQGDRGELIINGGRFTSAKTAFQVSNASAYITLDRVALIAGDGTLVRAAADKRWGREGRNGGFAHVTAVHQILRGDLVTDATSMIDLILSEDCQLEGATHGQISLTLDGQSRWSVTADSHIRALRLTSATKGDLVGQIVGNGHTVSYDPAQSPTLGGRTYQLSGGGMLKPEQ